MQRHPTRIFLLLALLASACSEQDLTSPSSPNDLPSLEITPLGVTAGKVSAFEPGASIAAARLQSAALAAATTTTCTFTISGTTMRLDADCTTDGTIFIPDGFTLDGQRHTITGVDPVPGHFTGAVVQNGGTTARVRNLGVTVSGLADVCDAGDDRLRGIMFNGASGTIEKNTVVGINQGASGCQEGNAIEVRNAPFDGTHVNTQNVKVKDNTIDDYQKTGIVANGDVNVKVEKNDLGASFTQENLAANGIQVGFGGIAEVKHNDVEGNQWLGLPTGESATAILIYAADGVDVNHNKSAGNSNIGLYVGGDAGSGFSDNGRFDHNRLDDVGPDGANTATNGDTGIFNDPASLGNGFHHNKVCGFATPFDPDPLPGDKNKSC